MSEAGSDAEYAHPAITTRGPNLATWRLTSSRPPSSGAPAAAAAAASSGSDAGTLQRRYSVAAAGGGGSAVAALAVQLLARMLRLFGAAASDAKAKAIIKTEVAGFMKRVAAAAGQLKEEELVDLENRIRSKLTGETPKRMTRATEKRMQMEADEWGKMYQFDVAVGHARDVADAAARRAAQRRQRGVLDGQMQELAEAKAARRAADAAFAAAQKERLAEAERVEAAKQAAVTATSKKLAMDQLGQLQEEAERRDTARRKKAAAEQQVLERVAWETKQELEREEAHFKECKQQLNDFLRGNEAAMSARADAKARTAAEDLEYQRQWVAQLDKLEAHRRSALDKVLAKQSKQAESAQRLPEYKRWIDPAIIERNFRQKEAELDAEEARRAADKHRRDCETQAAQLAQMSEKIEQRHVKRMEDKKCGAAIAAGVEAWRQGELQHARAAAVGRAAFRSHIDEQLKDKAHQRRCAPMTDAELKINRKKMEKVKAFHQTGKVVLPGLL